jgi:bifunctional enzyme CysN/CysC
MVREMVAADEFFEVFVDTPLDLCEARDPKGLYAKARAGDIPNFTGINAPFERPSAPDIRIDGAHESPEQAAARVVELVFGTVPDFAGRAENPNVNQ